MGKIRIKTLGDEEAEKKQKQKLKEKREQKRTAKDAETQKISVSESFNDSVAARETSVPSVLQEKPTTQKAQKKEEGKGKSVRQKKRSKRYKTAKTNVDKNKTYALKEALELLSKVALNKFDETVELHLNTIEAGISGNLSLPHGTGKKTIVAIANDQIIAEVEKGKINFDILLASPEIMPKLAKVARILGPKGLMPNPKNGTITKNPEDLIKKFEQGQVNYKTEAKNPIIHLSVGKISFGKDKLEDNIQVVLKAIQASRIKKAVLKSTMSPAIKIQI